MSLKTFGINLEANMQWMCVWCFIQNNQSSSMTFFITSASFVIATAPRLLLLDCWHLAFANHLLSLHPKVISCKNELVGKQTKSLSAYYRRKVIKNLSPVHTFSPFLITTPQGCFLVVGIRNPSIRFVHYTQIDLIQFSGSNILHHAFWKVM